MRRTTPAMPVVRQRAAAARSTRPTPGHVAASGAMSASGASTKPRSAMPGCGTVSSAVVDALVAEHQQVQIQRARPPALARARGPARPRCARSAASSCRGGQLRQQAGDGIDEITLLHGPEGPRAVQARARDQPACRAAAPAPRTRREPAARITQVAAEADVGRHPDCHSRTRGSAAPAPATRPVALAATAATLATATPRRARPPAPRPCPRAAAALAACSARPPLGHFAAAPCPPARAAAAGRRRRGSAAARAAAARAGRADAPAAAAARTCRARPARSASGSSRAAAPRAARASQPSRMVPTSSQCSGGCFSMYAAIGP